MDRRHPARDHPVVARLAAHRARGAAPDAAHRDRDRDHGRRHRRRRRSLGIALRRDRLVAGAHRHAVRPGRRRARGLSRLPAGVRCDLGARTRHRHRQPAVTATCMRRPWHGMDRSNELVRFWPRPEEPCAARRLEGWPIHAAASVHPSRRAQEERAPQDEVLVGFTRSTKESEAMAFKELVFSGVQPTGNLHLGNYLGAIVKFVALQQRYDCIYCVVDLHAITVWQDPLELPRATREVTAAFIACGIDPKKHIVFNQSQVAEHAELAWVFNCVARLGWLNRMTQFKEKAGKDRENASVGLYAYPALMAADILVYRATHVPVGEDQKQHLELSRDIAQKFNNDF